MRGSWAGSVFLYPQRIYVEETDAGGIVFHANYLRLGERARTEMLRDLGYTHWQEHTGNRLFFVVRRCALEFYASAKVDDLITIQTNLLQLGRVKLIIRQEFWRDKEHLVDLEITLALIDRTGKPTPFPEKLHALLNPLVGKVNDKASKTA